MRNVCWDFIENRLFYPKTKMLYDIIFHPDTPMPTVEDVKNSVPNANGYGTMTEDGMISGGTALHGLCLRMQNHDGEGAEFAKLVAEGMLDCAESGIDGFLPRSIQPIDGKCHYKDASRDQLTLFFYGILLYVNSGFCPRTLSDRAVSAVERIIARIQKYVTPENNFDLLCEDGTPSLNSVMWGEKIGAHEVGRLPFFYLSAYVLTENTAYLDRYRSIRDEAISRSFPVDCSASLYIAHQMAVSLDACCRFDPDREYREKYAEMLNRLTDTVDAQIDRVSAEIASLDEKYFRTRTDWQPFYAIQNAAIIPMLEAMAPHHPIDENAVNLMKRTLESLDLPIHESALPIHFVTAMELCAQ